MKRESYTMDHITFKIKTIFAPLLVVAMLNVNCGDSVLRLSLDIDWPPGATYLQIRSQFTDAQDHSIKTGMVLHGLRDETQFSIHPPQRQAGEMRLGVRLFDDYYRYGAGSITANFSGASLEQVIPIEPLRVMNYDAPYGNCIKEGWCFIPLSEAASGFNGVWGDDCLRFWAVGNNGRISAWIGSSWIKELSMVSQDLKGIWGNKKDIWVVGQEKAASLGVIIRRKNQPLGTWVVESPVGATDGLNAVWGTSENDAWAVGFNGAVVQWDGTTWSQHIVPFGTVAPDLRGVWGSAKNDYWAVGADFSTGEPVGAIWHYDGNAWNQIRKFDKGYFGGIFGFTKSDIWVVGEAGRLVHWDGNRWSSSNSGIMSNIYSVYGTRSNDVWAVADGVPDKWIIIHWNGSEWSRVTQKNAISFTSVFGVGQSDIWAVGQDGTNNGMIYSYMPADDQ